MKKLAFVSAVLLVAAGASAGVAEWGLTLQMGTNNPWNAVPASTVTQTAGGYDITGSDSNANRTFAWRIEVRNESFDSTRGGFGGLFVSAFFSVTNNTAAYQQFTINNFQPGAVLPGPNTATGSISGSVGDGDFLDLAGQPGVGAEVRTFGGNPFYQATIDGNPFQNLYNAPVSVFAPSDLTNAIATQNFINIPAPAVFAIIGIANRFELSPGDNAQFTSTFRVVPTPGALALVGLAGLAGIRRRR